MAVKICEECGKGFEAKRSDARYCSKKCKTRAYRKRKGVERRIVVKPGRPLPPLPTDTYDDVVDAIDDARRVSNEFNRLACTAPAPVRPGCARIGYAITAAIEREEWER